jgi:hypothetical protein
MVMAPPLAQDVNGRHFRRGIERGPQGAVIMQAEVAAEPMDDALHG